MGNSTYSESTTREYSRSYERQSRGEIFRATHVHADMNPKDLRFREARDSEAHPETVPVIIALDVTGSMGKVPEQFIKGQLGTLFETLISNGVEHPAVCFTGIGDHISDTGPLQVGQFESGSVELDKWLKNIWLECGGGGGARESYLLAYLFAGRHTVLDSVEKRNKKGFLFTIGDEATHRSLNEGAIKTIMGGQSAVTTSVETLLAEAREKYEVFHIHVNTTGYKDNVTVIESWRELLGQNLIICNNDDRIAEIIAATIRVCRGQSIEDITSSTHSAVVDAVSPVFVRRPSSAV